MKTLSENRRARHEYNILEKLEVGIEMMGTEVKSARAGRMQITGSYAKIFSKLSTPGVDNLELWLVGSEIPAHQPKNAPRDFDPSRTRKLLAQRKEIKSLAGKLNESGLVLVPIKAYEKKGLVKLELCLARSQKKHDRRESLKKRAVERDEGRKLKR